MKGIGTELKNKYQVINKQQIMLLLIVLHYFPIGRREMTVFHSRQSQPSVFSQDVVLFNYVFAVIEIWYKTHKNWTFKKWSDWKFYDLPLWKRYFSERIFIGSFKNSNLKIIGTCELLFDTLFFDVRMVVAWKIIEGTLMADLSLFTTFQRLGFEVSNEARSSALKLVTFVAYIVCLFVVTYEYIIYIFLFLKHFFFNFLANYLFSIKKIV